MFILSAQTNKIHYISVSENGSKLWPYKEISTDIILQILKNNQEEVTNLIKNRPTVAKPEIYVMIKFLKTCDFCPEQYDAFIGTSMVGYIRLRHGKLTASYPDIGKDIIYTHIFDDYNNKGEFDSDEERIFHLNKIAKLICAQHYPNESCKVFFKISTEEEEAKI